MGRQNRQQVLASGGRAEWEESVINRKERYVVDQKGNRVGSRIPWSWFDGLRLN